MRVLFNIFLLCFCMFSNAVFALTLTVKDANETLIGASVYINGAEKAIGVTDLDGKIELKSVKTGDKIRNLYLIPCFYTL